MSGASGLPPLEDLLKQFDQQQAKPRKERVRTNPECLLVTLTQRGTEEVYALNPNVIIHEFPVFDARPMFYSYELVATTLLESALRRTLETIRKENPTSDFYENRITVLGSYCDNRVEVAFFWGGIGCSTWFKYSLEKVMNSTRDIEYVDVMGFCGVSRIDVERATRPYQALKQQGLPSIDELTNRASAPRATSRKPHYILIALDHRVERYIKEINPEVQVRKFPTITDYHWGITLEWKMGNVVRSVQEIHDRAKNIQLVFCHSILYEDKPWASVGTAVTESGASVPRKLVLYVGPGMRPYAEDIIKRAK